MSACDSNGTHGCQRTAQRESVLFCHVAPWDWTKVTPLDGKHHQPWSHRVSTWWLLFGLTALTLANRIVCVLPSDSRRPGDTVAVLCCRLVIQLSIHTRSSMGNQWTKWDQGARGSISIHLRANYQRWFWTSHSPSLLWLTPSPTAHGHRVLQRAEQSFPPKGPCMGSAY